MATIIITAAIITAASAAAIAIDAKEYKEAKSKLTIEYIQAEGDRKFKAMLNEWRAEKGMEPIK